MSVDRLPNAPRVNGQENIPGTCPGTCPGTGSGIITTNHYSPPGFPAWWITVGISSAVPIEITWVITSAWRFDARPPLHLLTPLTHWVIAQMARVYGFLTLPPMPPDPADTAERASGVRRVLEFQHRHPQALIGFSPEGRDTPGGILDWPFPGTGRFLLQMTRHGCPIYPVGVFETDGVLCLHFGPAYYLTAPSGLSPDERDLHARRAVMQAIAPLLPEALQGEFGSLINR